MAVFDVSFANKKTQKSSGDYSVLVDQLSILESSLAADGKLTPGDYKLLVERGQSVYANPGLTPANRGAIEAKIAGWKSQASQTQLKDNQDITKINNEAKDDTHSRSMFLGNNPKGFLTAQAASQNAKITALADAINQRDASGQDSSAYVNEYTAAVQEYSDTLEALDVVKNHQAGQAPSSDQVAYVTTNGKGEITNVQVGREGNAPTGHYYETNGVYGGLKIYGALNKKEDGKNVFMLGDKTFSAADVVVPGPDGSLKSSTLIDSSQQKGRAGVFTTAVAGYSEVDPSRLRTQSSIPTGSYGRGSNGFLYKKADDGSYTKYVNADATKLGIMDNEIISLPNALEQSILPQVKTTVDANVVQPTMPTPVAFGQNQSTGTQPTAPTTTPDAGHPAASAPTSRAPQGVLGIAKGAIDAAGGFLGRLFGGK